MEQQEEQVISLRLSRVLEDIGVNRPMIVRRRRTWLMRETAMTTAERFKGTNSFFFHFGSQSEGTTTPGMKSDIDTLVCLNIPHVILNYDDWQQGKDYLLAVKTEQLPPQHCLLQRLRPDILLPQTHMGLPTDVIDNEGRVLHTHIQAENCKFISQLNQSGEIVQNGPSRSWNENDFVFAYYCCTLPQTCQNLFRRPRPGHWPRLDTLTKAKYTGVFLVPQGYSELPSRTSRCRSSALHITPYEPYYPQSKWEWRFSTSMMERLLMFDMNTEQCKAYVFIKILRKTFLCPIVGDRLSTFHIKTAMLFTIETYPSEIWRDDNLVKCVIYCLTTLRRWLRLKYCPHYTIDRVNLFTGKLFKHELRILSAIISSLMESNMSYISQIDMDLLGVRMLRNSSGILSESNEIKQNNQLILKHLNKHYTIPIVIMAHSYILGLFLNTWEDLNPLFTKQLHRTLQQINHHGTDLERESVLVIIPLLYSSLASILASRCIHFGQSITREILLLYRMSFDSDLLSSRLKFASFSYCIKQYDAAMICLTSCESSLGPEVWHCCTCSGRSLTEHSSEFMDLYENSTNNNMLRNYTSVCLHFIPQEQCCVPKFLVYEMFRTVTDEDRERRQPELEYSWMDSAVIDCVPFLHYLQYLTYRQLDMHNRKHAALEKLENYIYVDSECNGHIDTALNMLGNCYELENILDVAWTKYAESLTIYPRNNAANWHVARLFHKFLNS
ncbi:uncharacterized protein LOC128245046 [Mya arenaria]|uniref:uncharacterized protein LOC128245046 n=1 Tax=Mya arenaria TaxID=6604 RepID=UPI0022E65E55|nr:uncharacterized protein LOC128245046 [Mya arenaria]